VYYNHPLIKKDAIEYRAYQANIAKTCIDNNTLVVLPTGMGKTVVALMVIAEILRRSNGKILFMAPTKPLVEQHARFLKDYLVNKDVTIFTGEVAPAGRDDMWRDNDIIVSTPQVISNDILSRKIDLSSVSLMIFDEAHKSSGDYAYVFIGETYKKFNGRVLAMTASPGSSAAKIAEVCNNIGVSAVELRTEYDADVVNYTHRISLERVDVEMTENARKIGGILRGMLDEKKKELQRHGFSLSPKRLTVRELLAIQGEIRAKLHSGARQSSYYHAISVAAMAMKINQALEYVETQSVGALRNYLERLETDAGGKGASKAAKMLACDEKMREVFKLSRDVQAEHPKVAKVRELTEKILKYRPESRIIIFTHYRDVSELVCTELGKLPGAKPVRFIGQATKGDDRGLKQKEQVEILSKFKSGEFNILVATSVAEEGLDIPSTDFVIFYEPVPSEIRSIQRRGRTGRVRTGKAYILVTKGTRDEPYFWTSISREKKMRSIIALKNELKDKLKIGEPIREPVALAKDAGEAIADTTASAIADKDTAGSFDKTTGKSRIESATLPPVTPLKENKTPAAPDGQLTLSSFEGEKTREINSIVVDTRELSSEVARELSRLDFRLDTKQLDVGDYILSERVAVERKEVSDFLQSILDGRLFQQVMSLRRAYMRPIVVIEGEGLFTTRNISDGAIYGALASITVDFGIPVIFTRNGRETAGFLAAVFRREYGEKHAVSIRGQKGAMSLAERQQFIVEGLPNISATLAQRLLAHFGSVRAITGADIDELSRVRGIGKATAEELVRVLNEKYFGKDGNEKGAKSEKKENGDKDTDEKPD